MLRFELEVEVIAKNLEVEDLPEAWNKKFKDYFGRDVTKSSDGILQDVHWSIGAFGYFPTYTLGNLNAGCLFEKMKEDIPNMDERFEKGDVSSATNWLTENIHQHGSVYEPSELIKNATGEELTPEPFLNYLDEKFSDMYEV
jgi:carboxypeptidase Taq